jgi:hypothetical protein
VVLQLDGKRRPPGRHYIGTYGHRPWNYVKKKKTGHYLTIPENGALPNVWHLQHATWLYVTLDRIATLTGQLLRPKMHQHVATKYLPADYRQRSAPSVATPTVSTSMHSIWTVSIHMKLGCWLLLQVHLWMLRVSAYLVWFLHGIIIFVICQLFWFLQKDFSNHMSRTTAS